MSAAVERDFYWLCACGWRTTENQYFGFRFDFGCPRCGRSFGKFSRVETFRKVPCKALERPNKENLK